MPYRNLHSLLQSSRSSREYFLSLPVKTQIALHQMDASSNGAIRTAQELHRTAGLAQKTQHQLDISRFPGDPL